MRPTVMYPKFGRERSEKVCGMLMLSWHLAGSGLTGATLMHYFCQRCIAGPLTAESEGRSGHIWRCHTHSCAHALLHAGGTY
jgi:hypothetical protein